MPTPEKSRYAFFCRVRASISAPGISRGGRHVGTNEEENAREISRLGGCLIPAPRLTRISTPSVASDSTVKTVNNLKMQICRGEIVSPQSDWLKN